MSPSHPPSTVSYIAQEINVMYLGRIVESGSTKRLLDDPKHPYTDALISAIPIPDPDADRTRTRMSGAPRDPIDIGDGCRFRDRCPEAEDICESTTPEYIELEGNRHTACHLHYNHPVDG
jgi:peptide/nickel transport system ATP-binding protein